MLAQYVLHRVSVCHKSVEVLQRWLNLGSHKQRHAIAQDSSFPTPKISTKFQRGAKWRWGWLKSAIFDQYLAVSKKQCKIGTLLLRKANRNSHALYQMALFSVTLCDRAYIKTTPNHPFSTFCIASSQCAEIQT